MKRREFIALLGGVTVWPLAADAQLAKKVPRVGFLANVRSPATEAFERGLRELGYVEGKNIVIEWRLAQGKFERLPALAADLVSLNVDVIVAPAPLYIRAAREATGSIPIVFALVGDPVGYGIVASLAHPGGNMTGLSSQAPELVAKQLELLKETVPGLMRVAVFSDSNPGDWQNDVETAARTLNVQLQFLEVRDPAEFDAAFDKMVMERTEAVMVLGGIYFYPHRSRFAELAMKHRLPSILNLREYAEAGGFMVYAASTYDLMSRAATYVDKILKGAKPAHLPVQQPTKFELVINLRTAKALGITVPPSLLGRADEVIE
jgi:putative tryptophan/tyrosine transport system substrate-binding protein